MHFDCIIPTAGKDCLLVRKNLPLISEYISPNKIFIITKPAYFAYFKRLKKELNQRVILIAEDDLLPQITYKTISDFLVNINYSIKSTGWYYQQFLKMGFALSDYANEYYLSWDADTLPTKEMLFFKGDTPYFTMKDEHHEAYFLTLKKLLNLEKIVEKSFIAENMMFNTIIMKELIMQIEKSEVIGKNWCEKVINSMPLNKNNSFSEFETYGTFVMTYYPHLYKFRELKTFRDGGKELPRFYSSERIKILADKYDMLTIEQRHDPKGLIGCLSKILKIIVIGLNKILDLFYKN